MTLRTLREVSVTGISFTRNWNWIFSQSSSLGKSTPSPMETIPDARVAQVFQLYQSARVAAGETGKILDDENIVLVGHESPAHLLIASRCSNV